jgi:hypothetical protein
MVAVFIFFVAIEPLRNLPSEPRLLQGYDVTEVQLEGDTLTGHNMTARIALAAAKSGRPISAHRRRLGVAAIVLASAITFFSQCALADEGGVSFWVPGSLEASQPLPSNRVGRWLMSIIIPRCRQVATLPWLENFELDRSQPI